MAPDPLPTLTFPPLSLDADGNHLSAHTASPETVPEILKKLPDIYASRLQFHPKRQIWTLDVTQATVTDLPLRIASRPVLPVGWERKYEECSEFEVAASEEGEVNPLLPTQQVRGE